MFFYGPSKDKNVVQIDNYYIFYNEIPKNVIHYYLESSQTIDHFKKYHKRLKQTIVSIEDCLPLIARLDIYIIKPLPNVELGKVLGSTKLRDKLGNQ